MKKGLTELVFILDRSGSMAGLERDTIGGFNAMIEKQKREAGEVLVSTVLFDSECSVIHDRVDIRELTALTEKEYYVRGTTALLDAIGGDMAGSEFDQMERLQAMTGVQIPGNLAGLQGKPERHTGVIPKEDMLEFVLSL